MKKENIKYLLIVTLFIAVIGVMAVIITSPNVEVKDNTNEILNEQVASKINLKELVQIGNRDNPQINVVSHSDVEKAEVTLSLLGLTVQDVGEFAVSIDPRVESAHAVGIFKAKDNNSTIKDKLLEYIRVKQKSLEENTELYNIAITGTVAEQNGYIILVMTNDSDTTLNKVRNAIKVQEYQRKLDGVKQREAWDDELNNFSVNAGLGRIEGEQNEKKLN